MSGKVVNEMKYKKRKKFYHVLIPRMLTAWALAAILTACGIIGFYEYIADTFIGITQDSNLTGSRENQVRNLFKAGRWETNPGLVEIYVKLPSVIFEGIGMPDSMASLNVKQYAEIYDIEKDRALADSEMILSLICPTEDEEFGAMVYTSNFDKLESIPPFAEMGKKLNSADNSWDEWFGNKRRYFYAVETTDFYIRKEDHSFYPGNVRITEYSFRNRISEGRLNSNYDYRSETETVDCTPYIKDAIAGYEHVILYDGDWSELDPQQIAASGGQISGYVRSIGIEGTTESESAYAKAIAEQMQLFQGSGEYSGSIKPSPFEDGNLISYTSFNLGEGHEDLAYHYIAVIPHTFRTFFPVYRIMAIVFFALFSGIALLVSVIRYRNLLYFYRNEDFRKTLMNSMAHDLKTPLAVMSGYAQNLKENVQTDKREHYAGAIEENVEYMNSLIADILALSRMEENMLHPHKEKVDLCEMMREIASQYDISLQEKNLTFSPEGKFVKNADPALMKRALENLFTNALKYTEEGGQIKVTVSTVPFNGYFEIRNAPAKEVSVKTKKLWEPFVKGDDSRSDKTGTGVGLAITGNILSLHHMKGRIVCKDGSFAVRLGACHF